MRVGCCGVERHTSDAVASWWVLSDKALQGMERPKALNLEYSVTMEAGLLPVWLRIQRKL